MWDIIRLPCWDVYVNICLEDKDEIIWSMKIIRFLKTYLCLSGPLLESICIWAWMGSDCELGWSDFMVLGAPVGYTLEESIGVFIGLSLGNPFGTLEISFTGVSPGKMGDLMIDTKEVSLVVLSMGIPIVSLLKFQNCGDVMPGTLLGDPLGLWFGSEAVRYWCSCRRLTDFSEDTCGRGGYFLHPFLWSCYHI